MGNKKSRYTWRNLRKGRVLALLAAIGITGGGVKALASAVNTGNEKAVNIEEISNDKSMLKSLGISKKTAERINSINEKFEHGDIGRKEMEGTEETEGLVEKIHATQLDVIKEKLAKALKVDKGSITLDYSADTNANETQCVIVDGKRYNNKGLISGDSIDNEIGDFIVDVVNCNRLINTVKGKIYIKGIAIEKCKKFMKNVNDLAFNKEIEVDGMGNISTKKIKNEKVQLVDNKVQTKAVEGKEFKASISEKTYNGINKNSDAEQQKNEINKVNDDKTLYDEER